MQVAVVQGLRAATGLTNRRPGQARHSDQQVLLTAEGLDFDSRLTLSRLSLLASAALHGSEALHRLFD